MPNLEPVVIAGQRYAIRQVGLPSVLYPQTATPISPEIQVLSKLLIARPLPASSLPSSPDFVSGSWTGRLGDAGDMQLQFPNKEASDGVPWRQRFDPTGHLQFLECYYNGNLDSCCVIDTCEVDEQGVSVHGQDGWFLLKKAYERDWTVVESPRDVIERATQVWVPTAADNFPYANSANPAAQWTVTTNSGGTVAMINPGGGCKLQITSSNSSLARIASSAIGVTATGAWSATANAQYAALDPANNHVLLKVTESSGDLYVLGLNAGQAYLLLGGTQYAQVKIPTAASYSLRLESDGEWIYGFVSGQLIGSFRRNSTTTTTITTTVELGAANTGAAGTAVVTGVLTESLQPFLQRGSDKGDYVLPGTASTYPTGGLHARYYSDTDLASDTNRLVKILNPTRSIAYAGSGPAEYQNQQDATINTQANPTPGAATSNWSCKWFGAVYLKLSAGDYRLQWSNPGGVTSGTAVRIWVGKTRFGDQLVPDQGVNADWNLASGFGAFGYTISASALKGTSSYGGATVQRDGWYPIKVEYAVDSTAHTAGTLYFTNSPAAYTDPGGTAIASGAQITVIPATSLSPLGCVDQRYQGASHFDLAQQTVQGFGYQASVEPQNLESGLFPGVLAPRIREGQDTDLILTPDTGPRTDGEGLLNYSSTLDGTDFASSLQGNGAGVNNGTSGQLQAIVYDPPTLLAALFDAQQWQDFSDAAFSALLQALLNTQLGLQLSPWQLLSADPTGAARLAYTWPLPGTIAAMRCRPGDGMRIQARDINVFDTAPRQILVITRSIAPAGTTSSTASFANRPKNPARSLKRALYTATRLQRNYQRQLVTLSGALVTGSIAGGATGGNSMVLPLVTDQLVRVYLRVSANSGPQAFNVLVNGVDQTTALNGPWTTVPVNLALGPVATPDANGQLYAAVKNNSGSASTYTYQLFADVLR